MSVSHGEGQVASKECSIQGVVIVYFGIPEKQVFVFFSVLTHLDIEQTRDGSGYYGWTTAQRSDQSYNYFLVAHSRWKCSDLYMYVI